MLTKIFNMYIKNVYKMFWWIITFKKKKREEKNILRKKKEKRTKKKKKFLIIYRNFINIMQNNWTIKDSIEVTS